MVYRTPDLILLYVRHVHVNVLVLRRARKSFQRGVQGLYVWDFDGDLMVKPLFSSM